MRQFTLPATLSRCDPPRILELGGAVVHLWRCQLDDMLLLRDLQPALCRWEKARASAFKREERRNEYLLCRGWLRSVLGGYLTDGPYRAEFFYNRHGKPGLAEEDEPDALQFNLSHAGKLALLAVSSGRRVGVDLERVRATSELNRVAKRFFTPGELEGLSQVPVAAKEQALWEFWCCKEALAKAVGVGLSLPLRAFDLSQMVHAASSSAADPLGDRGSWCIGKLRLEEHYVGALAVEEKARQALGSLPPPKSFIQDITRCESRCRQSSI